uniref:Nuclear Hormone Receptor family n=1 Tax=Caenorhabditis tropicalis TaxID=1561998 RepID=A0A1I7V237_9PELO
MDGPSCVICGQIGQGNHFGVISCRACAAFFRYHCKPCRLKKCRAAGMDTSKFQHDRDALQISAFNRKRKIPQAMEIIYEKPIFVLFCPVDPSDRKKDSVYVDCNPLIIQAMKILNLGSETPLTAKNSLQKLSYGFNCMKRTEELKRIHKVAREEVTMFWEFHMLTTARWLTYLDDFQDLDQEMKTKILFSVWHVWGRLDKLMATALYRIRNKDAKWSERVIGNGVVTDTKNVLTDSSWMSRYPPEQLRYFLDGIRGWDLFPIIDELQTMNITETELTFMLAHLCFQYVASRFGGKISEIVEGFLETLTNDLHSYYVEEKKTPRYSGRLMKMLRINNEIIENIRVYRGRAEVAKVFDVFHLDFSHPEMFRDTGFI